MLKPLSFKTTYEVLNKEFKNYIDRPEVLWETCLHENHEPEAWFTLNPYHWSKARFVYDPVLDKLWEEWHYAWTFFDDGDSYLRMDWPVIEDSKPAFMRWLAQGCHNPYDNGKEWQYQEAWQRATDHVKTILKPLKALKWTIEKSRTEDCNPDYGTKMWSGPSVMGGYFEHFLDLTPDAAYIVYDEFATWEMQNTMKQQDKFRECLDNDIKVLLPDIEHDDDGEEWDMGGCIMSLTWHEVGGYGHGMTDTHIFRVTTDEYSVTTELDDYLHSAVEPWSCTMSAEGNGKRFVWDIQTGGWGGTDESWSEGSYVDENGKWNSIPITQFRELKWIPYPKSDYEPMERREKLIEQYTKGDGILNVMIEDENGEWHYRGEYKLEIYSENTH